ncbi:MAG: cyanophycin synthetase [Hyphomonadaceae bacterium]|nr:cyanophycin synthetase [Hyphomonadaceae bacterium]
MKIWRTPYPKFGAGPGLERVRKVADVLGIDLAAFGESGAVIVGSNGKGSTAAMCAALLQGAGRSVGLFTSPHLLQLNERFRGDGADIDDAALGIHWDRVIAAVDKAGFAKELGGFEFLFLIAASWFAERGFDHTIWEAGIGGRLDPVRLIRAKHVALTSLDLEHTELLGSTIEEIGLDKLDAAPPGSSVFAPLGLQGHETFARACAKRGVDYQTIAPWRDAALPLSGAHQQQNAALALSLATALTQIEADALAPGFARTRWPGRLEVLEREPFLVIDVGHTPEGVRAALAGFEQMAQGRPRTLVCGVSRDKQAEPIIAALAPHFPRIVCAAAHHKGAPAGEIAKLAAAANSEAEISLAESVSEARRLAVASAGKDGAIYVAGGLFLAAELKAAHLGLDPDALAFF